MKIAIASSMQFHNQYCCSSDVEGAVMGILGQLVVDRLNKYGAPSIQAQRFWSTNEDAWVGVADGAAAWGDYVVALHTDSAGDRRGYTGSLLCYGDNQEGHRLGTIIQNRMLTDFGWPNAGGQYRQNDLYMLGLGTPSCLLEIANHSDPDDCKFILANLDKFADSIAWGIFEFLGINPHKNKPQEDDMAQPIPMNEDKTKWQGYMNFAAFPEACLLVAVSSGDAPGVPEPQGQIADVIFYIVQNGKWVPVDTKKIGNAGPTLIWRRAGYNGQVVVDSSGPSIVVQASA